MRLYLDTPLLVAALTNEDATEATLTRLGKQEPDSLAISEWVRTEFPSALSHVSNRSRNQMFMPEGA